MNNEKVFQIITDRVIKAIEEKKELVWQKSWNAYGGVEPQNAKTKRPYRGINKMLCRLFNNPYFLTYKQAKEINPDAKPQAGRAMPIIFWQWLYFTQEGKKLAEYKEGCKSVPLLKYYNVWNVDDIDGIEYDLPNVEKYHNIDLEQCEAIIKQMNPTLKHGGDRAYYKPSADFINMPKKEHFYSSESYYSILFHELAHWTGHSTRLDRGLSTKVAAFGSPDYSKEELVAEMTASFLCELTGIENEQLRNNHVAYITGWINVLKNDVKMLVYAGAQAQKAYDYITCAK